MEVTKIPKRRVLQIQPKQSLIVDKQQHRQKRVAAYCRVSTNSEEQLNSYENQKKTYTESIGKNPEWELVGIYADEGKSGTRAEKRPDFQRLIKDCLAGKIDIIVTKSVSRFARNALECLDFVRMLKSHGVGVIFEEQNINTLTTESELYLIIYAGFAQSESESISKNITWTFRKNFQEGKASFMYKKLLGYKKGEDGKPEIVPHEAIIVERIFNMFLAGMPISDISLKLQGENIAIPGKDFKFSRTMIISILRNERYCGDCILQKTVTLDCIEKKRIRNDGIVAPMYIVENNHPPIVSREIFNKTQEELSRRNAKTPQSQKNAITMTGKYSKYALTEVLKCAECGSRFKRVIWNNRGKRKVVWRCVSRLDYGTKFCKDSISVEESVLHEAIVRVLKRFNIEDETTYITMMKATIGDAIGLNGGSDEIDLLERRIETLNQKMLQIVTESVQNGEDIESHEEEFKEMSENIEQLKARIKAIRESESSDVDLQDRLKRIQDTIDYREAHQDIYDDSIVRQMIECIKVHHDGKITVIFGGGKEMTEELGA